MTAQSLGLGEHPGWARPNIAIKKLMALSLVLLMLASVQISMKTISKLSPRSSFKTSMKFYPIQSSMIRKDFFTRYGGKDYATNMFNDRILTFTNDPKKDKLKSPQNNHGNSTSTSSTTSDHTTENSNTTLNTAKRILYAIAKSQPFVIALGGYSVTIGRGNHFNQSSPFVLQRIL